MKKKGIQWVVKDPMKENYYWPSDELKKRAWVSDPEIYEVSSKDPIAWWGKLAKGGIDWLQDWKATYHEDSTKKFQWFEEGKLNMSCNIVDRHHKSKAEKVAIYWEPEDIVKSKGRSITYGELYGLVNKFASGLKGLGVKKGDFVGIYLPMVPEAIISMIACARVGAIHTVVFSAFSQVSLNERLKDAKAKILITADGYYRRGKEIELKSNADGGVAGSSVEKVIVVKRLGNKINMTTGRDLWWDEVMESAESECEPAVMDSEDPLFMLYTSGTTGKPKGIVHHTGGFAVGAYWTTKWSFDLHDDDVFFCTADIGWVAGHVCNCYGPLLNGASIVIYEGALDFPSFDRWWSIVEKYQVTIFFTSPTAMRMIKRQGEKFIEGHDLSSLRLLASGGEPINETTWKWYFEEIGGSRCPIIDMWGQTETSGLIVNALPGIGPFIPGVSGLAFPGVKIEVMSEQQTPTMMKEPGIVFIASPFPPSLFRTIFNNPEKYNEQFKDVGGEWKYCSSDGAYLFDEGSNIRFIGRVDEIVKVAGHRLSTAELEDALTKHPACSEAAVIFYPDEIKLEVPYAFIVLKAGFKSGPGLESSLKKKVDELIGPIARPDKIIFVEDLPRTRSGKILRRMLKDLVTMQPLGDVTSLMNPDSIDHVRLVLGLPLSPHISPIKIDFGPISPEKSYA